MATTKPNLKRNEKKDHNNKEISIVWAISSMCPCQRLMCQYLLCVFAFSHFSQIIACMWLILKVLTVIVYQFSLLVWTRYSCICIQFVVGKVFFFFFITYPFASTLSAMMKQTLQQQQQQNYTPNINYGSLFPITIIKCNL